MSMQPDHLSAAQALALCVRQEDQFFDRKSSDSKGKTAQKIAVAFGNSEGGEIAFGIKDEKEESDPSLRFSLFSTIEDANSILQCLYEINPALNFRYQFASVDHQAGYLLRVFVDKSQHVHATPDGTVYRRVGASSLPIKDPNEIAQLAFAKGAISFENQKIDGAQPEIIADSEQNKFLTSSIPEGPDPLSFSINEGLIDRVDWTPLVSGALLLADHPQGLVPTRCEVRVVFYDTKLEKPEREHLKINETLSGPLYDLIRKSVNRVTEILSDISIISPTGLEKVQYPPRSNP